MHIKTYQTMFLVFITTLFNSNPSFANEQKSTSNTLNDKIEQAYNNLLLDEPLSSQALLTLAQSPETTTSFLKKRLHPLSLSKKKLNEYLIDLGSNDQTIWRKAANELEYFDPRLALNLNELMDHHAVQEYPARHRLVDILSGREESYHTTERAFKYIKLRKVGEDGFNFCGSDKKDTCHISWWAEHKISKINVKYGNRKREWTRIIKCLALLNSFNSNNAFDIITTVAKGHPEAKPTQVTVRLLITK